MAHSLFTNDLAVGYNRRVLVGQINIRLEPGHILTLIGPNGAGKSTILKTITRQIPAVHGVVTIGDVRTEEIRMKDFARQTAVVLTERIHTEMMTCAEVVAMGRYPYTDMFGRLTDHDREVIARSLVRVHALDLADRDFSTLSDGQRQRIMLARAVCQEPEILVLDEPTAYLDIRYKIELLDILRKMAREQGTTVIMSLHEIDLAVKISDELLCLNGEKVTAYGTPEEVLSSHSIEELFGIPQGSFNLLFGSVELPKPEGKPQTFVVAGDGKGTLFFRELQKKGIPFAAGILFQNDVDYQTASVLSDSVVSVNAFEPVTEEAVRRAEELILQCRYVLDAGTHIGKLNQANAELLEFAQKHSIPVLKDLREVR